LKSEKGRDKLRYELSKRNDLNLKFARLIAKNNQNYQAIYDMLIAYHPPAYCYIMSSYAFTDEKEMPLDLALKQTINNSFNTLISCVPGKLAYFELEYGDLKYLLFRP
jgi:hypothetical protein